MWRHSENILVVSRILKAFFSSRIDPRAPAGRWLLCASVRAAKRLAWKLLRGFSPRLTVHDSGIRFTWCNSVGDFFLPHDYLQTLCCTSLPVCQAAFSSKCYILWFYFYGLFSLIFCKYAPWICRIDPFHMIPDVIPTPVWKACSPICLHSTCRSKKGPKVSPSAFIIRLPRSWAIYHLKTPALFSPHTLDVNGCVTLGCKIQVLLSQMCSQLPDLKLETQQRKELIICNSQCWDFLAVPKAIHMASSLSFRFGSNHTCSKIPTLSFTPVIWLTRMYFIYPSYYELSVKFSSVIIAGFVLLWCALNRIIMKREETFAEHCCPPAVIDVFTDS